MIRTAAVVVAVLSLAPTVGVVVPAAQQTPSVENFRTFAGSWSATGERQTIPTEGGRVAGIVHLSGAIVFTTGSELGGGGVLAEAIAFDDGRSIGVGRAVWTDARGDRVFSEIKGEPIASGRRILGTITGGTGNYDGVVGDYELTWQYVVRDNDTVQGRAVDLRGRFRKVTP